MFQQKLQEVHSDDNKSEIKTLNLEGCEATNLEGLSDEFDNLSSLSLANNKLTTLKSFPTLKTLTSLNLKGNQLEGGLDNLSGCTQLKDLNLGDNNFTSMEQLEPLKSCAALETINLHGCPLTKTPDYRTAIFEALPQVTSIDGTARGTERKEGENGTHTNGNHATVNGEGDAAHKEVGVDQLLKDDLEDDDEEYNPEGEEEDDEDDVDDDEEGEEEDEEEDAAEPRGVKRKHEEDPVAKADDKSANSTH